MPKPAMRPWSSTRTRSALRTAETRWETMTQVVFASEPRARRSAASVTKSHEGAGDGEALALAAREVPAAGGDRLVEA